MLCLLVSYKENKFNSEIGKFYILKGFGLFIKAPFYTWRYTLYVNLDFSVDKTGFGVTKSIFPIEILNKAQG